MNFTYAAGSGYRIRTRIRRIALTLLLIGIPSLPLAQAQSEPADPGVDLPDVVIIMADDMGYSDLGCFGGEIQTPNLDRLAGDGLRFTNFYSENMCWVSRAAMLTGIYHKTSMHKNAIHPRCMTLPEVLRGHGYQTRLSGKWHLAGKPLKIFPNDRGFDAFYGILAGAASFYAPASLSRDRTNIESEAEKDANFYLTDAISTEACQMIRSANARQPLFLNVAYTAAHWPLHASAVDIQAYRGKYAMGWDKLRETRLTRMKQLGVIGPDVSLSSRNPDVPAWDEEPNPAWQQRRMEVYAAQITAMDRGIGQLIEALRETQRLENTLILFTIDNGGCHVEYEPERKGDFLPSHTRDGRPMRPGNLPEIMPGPEDTFQSYGYGWANASNTPYRQYKQFDHEGGIRTPMIAHWPSGISGKGRLVGAVSHLIDIMPTVLAVAGARLPEEFQGHPAIAMDGASLAPSFRGEDLPGHQTLFFHHASGRAIRHGQWKLVAQKQQAWELYDLKHDPTESHDLAETMPEKVRELEARWDAESERLATRTPPLE